MSGARFAQLTAQNAPLDTALLQRMLMAEDVRGTRVEGIAPLLLGVVHADVRLRRIAVRAIGRLQRANSTTLAPLRSALTDPVPAVRSEAANALAQRLQGLPRTPVVSTGNAARAELRPEVRETQDLLTSAMEREADATVVGVVARSLGRLPLTDSAQARAVEHAIHLAVARLLARSPRSAASPFGELPAVTVHDVTEGLYALTRARRTLGGPSAEAHELLARALRYPGDARVRRMAAMALSAGGGFDAALVLAASRDADPQVRRLALANVVTLSAEARAVVVRSAVADPAPMVRVDAQRAVRAGNDLPDCTPNIAATKDTDPHVRLAAIDALGLPCADANARNGALRAIAASAAEATWHTPARALLALARVDMVAAGNLLARFTASRSPHTREYAARAAALLKNAGALRALAGDSVHNVVDAAIEGLVQVQQHAADSVYIAALGSAGNQVVMAAARALAGSTHAAAAPALLDAFDRLSAEQRENSRDARMAILTRLDALGASVDAPRLERYTADFDTTVAAKAAALMAKWTGRAVTAHPAPLAIRDEPLAAIAGARDLQLRITMSPASGGGTFLVRLFSDEAPATVARIVRLARAGYYNGLTFHRIATNFVLQGGSPDATEYVGDGPFMRDEVGLRSHDRGTLGISTRGRDTGDAQLFINVVDNPRLDHDYTVFGEITAGMAIVDHIIEGDVMARVEVLGRNVSRPE